MSSSVDSEIAQWQSEEHEIGMIEFAPTDEAGERFPYYALPESAVFLGIMEVDALCLSDDGSLCVCDNEVENRIICHAAKDQSSFVAAMKELEQHFEKFDADESYCEDIDAAARVRDQCSQVAGGSDYVSFFTLIAGSVKLLTSEFSPPSQAKNVLVGQTPSAPQRHLKLANQYLTIR